MSRRRGRRRSGGSTYTVVALLLAVGVIAGVVALIMRGDTTPRMRTERTTQQTVAQSPVPAAHEPTPKPAVAPSPLFSSSTFTAEPRVAPTPATPSTPVPSGPKLAIIIDDCGQWPVTERGFIALPVPLTLSVLPHVRYGSEIAHDAQVAGKGVMLHLPMEPVSGIDPGPGRITTAMSDVAITAQVRDDIASVPLATGVNNHEGSRATADDRVMRAVADVLAADHLFFIDSLTTGSSVAERDAHAVGIATASRDVFLDNVADVDATEAQLRRAARVAKAHGSAIAIGHPRPTTLTAVRALIRELESEGITLVFASDLVH